MSIIRLAFNSLKSTHPLITGGILTAISLVSGVSPQISWQTKNLIWSDSAFAQQFTPEEISNYARAGFQQEMLRQQVYQEIKSIVNQTPPDITCDRPESINSIDQNIRGIVNNYCQSSDRIVRENNLSVERFNQLKNYYDRRDSFYKQVQEQLLNIQN